MPLILLLLFLLQLEGCQKEPLYSDIPNIRFVSFTRITDQAGRDSAGIVRLAFTDGKGDIGLGPSDTLPPFNKGSEFYYNFFISYFEKQNGQYKKVTPPPPFPGADTLSSNSRIPDLRQKSGGKAIEGEIEMQLFTANPFSDFDTIRYEISICDRSLNRSNTVKTNDIILVK
jgi:hypothetical protein